MYEYRAVISSSMAAANGKVHMDCTVQRRLEDPPDPDLNPWIPVPNGHRTVSLDAALVQSILDRSITDNEKRMLLVDALRSVITTWRLDEADRAEQGIINLIPSESWPVNVPL